MKTDLYNLEGGVVGSMELPDAVFGVPWKPAVVHQVLRAQLANRRRPWAHAKGRGEVRGGGRKPWRQKGTGRARHGSIRSPIWVGGGKAHGPSKERSYAQKINKKMKRLAILSVLSKKRKEGELTVLEHLTLPAPKTKLLAASLLKLLKVGRRKTFDALLVAGPEERALFRAASNLPKVKALHAENLNVHDLLNYKHIFLAASAVPVLVKQYHPRSEK